MSDVIIFTIEQQRNVYCISRDMHTKIICCTSGGQGYQFLDLFQDDAWSHLVTWIKERSSKAERICRCS